MHYILKSPILGFENVTEVEFQRIDSLFAKISNQNLGFEVFLANPYMLLEKYSFSIPKYIELLLDLNTQSAVEVYCVLVLQKNREDSLVNLLAPILFNPQNKKAGQVVLSMLDYPNLSFKAALSSFVSKSA